MGLVVPLKKSASSAYLELKNLLNHFIWNWDEYLAKNKVVFKSQ